MAGASLHEGDHRDHISFLVKRRFSMHKKKTIFMREIAQKKIRSPAGLTLTIEALVPKN